MKHSVRMTLTALAAALTIGGLTVSSTVNAVEITSVMKNAQISELTEDTRVFEINKQIDVKYVRFKNRFGIEVAGHLYLPENFSAGGSYAAVALSGPFGAVKEQSSGLYAQELARRGFVTLAFDPSFTGESGGEVHNAASPDIMTEDFSAAVDFLGSIKGIDREKIGAVGICGLSGAAVTAAINDVRIKAVAVSSMYNMSESIRDHYKGVYYTQEQREKVKNFLAKMRWAEMEKGEPIPSQHEIDASGDIEIASHGLPVTLPEGADPVTTEFFKYYREKRGYHPRSINSNTAWSSTTPYGFFNFYLTEHVEELSPRPLMIMACENAHSKYFSDELYERAQTPKEYIVVKNATHTDLYDQMDKIPFDSLEKFFRDNLK